MIFEYEKICREAGLSEEAIHEIYNMFNAGYQRMYRQKKARKESHYEFVNIDGMANSRGETSAYDIPDPSVDVEEEILHKIELERLHEVLDMLLPEDRSFILDYFNGEGKFLDDLAERYGLTRNQAIGKKKAIIRLLRELY